MTTGAVSTTNVVPYAPLDTLDTPTLTALYSEHGMAHAVALMAGHYDTRASLLSLAWHGHVAEQASLEVSRRWCHIE